MGRVRGFPTSWGRSVVAFSLLAFGLVEAGYALELQLWPDRLEVQQLVPGGQVAVLSTERRTVGFAPRLETLVRTATDDNGDGTAVLTLDEPASEASVWIAVELATGQLASFSQLEGAPFPLSSPLARQTGTGIIVVAGLPSVRFLLVRAGVGLWQLTAADGGLSENTGVADGKVELLEPAWEPVLGPGDPPGPLQPTDLVVVLNAVGLEVDASLYGGLDELP